MIITPSMGLKRWDQPNDIFSYTELSDNWAAIDAHDHTTGKGVQVPTGGLANLAVTEPKLANDAVTVGKLASNAVIDTKIASGAVTTSKIGNDAVGVTQLASVAKPGTLLAPYRLVLGGPTQVTNSAASGLNVAGDFASGSGVSNTVNKSIFHLNPADYAVSGLNTRFRMRFSMGTNGTSPSVIFSFGLYPVTAVGGAANQTSVTLGTIVTDSSILGPSPSANDTRNGGSSDFAIASTGYYAFGVTCNAVPAASSLTMLHLRLEVHNTV